MPPDEHRGRHPDRTGAGARRRSHDRPASEPVDRHRRFPHPAVTAVDPDPTVQQKDNSPHSVWSLTNGPLLLTGTGVGWVHYYSGGFPMKRFAVLCAFFTTALLLAWPAVASAGFLISD